jgi:hypothetical protein
MLIKSISLQMSGTRRLIPIAVALSFVAAACTQAGAATTASPPTATSSPTAALTSSASQPSPVPTAPPAAKNVRIEDPNEYVYSQLLPFDGIRPIYDPQFASAADAPLQDDELVMGFALGDEAKAYPIAVLRSREMVNDELAGIPILVTW